MSTRIHFRLVILMGLLLILVTACLKKDLEMEIYHDGCNQFSFEDATFTVYGDPSCDYGAVSAYCCANFGFDGKVDCLQKLVFEGLQILDTLGQQIPNMLYSPNLFVGDPNLTIDGRNSQFCFYYNFPSPEAAARFSNITVYFHGEGYVGEKTNVEFFRVYGNCSKPVMDGFPTTDVQVNSTNGILHVKIDPVKICTHEITHVKDSSCNYTTVDVKTDTYTLTPLSVYLNGQWVLREHNLTGIETYDWPIHLNLPNEMMVICPSFSFGREKYCTFYLNENAGINCSMDPDRAQVIRF